MWPVGTQPTNTTGLTLVLTLPPLFTGAISSGCGGEKTAGPGLKDASTIASWAQIDGSGLENLIPGLPIIHEVSFWHGKLSLEAE